MKHKFLYKNITLVKLLLYYKLLNKFWLSLFLICVTTCIVYEIILMNITAPFFWMVGLGKVLSQLSYGYATGYLLFFITYLIPQSDKRINLYLYVYNRFFNISKFVDEIFERNPKRHTSDRALSKNEVKEYLKLINPQEPYITSVTVGIHTFETFYSFLDFKINQLNIEIELIMRHQDLLDMTDIENISIIQDKINMYKTFFPILRPSNNDAEYLATFLEDLPKCVSKFNSHNKNIRYLLHLLHVKKQSNP